jgi:hypothetical protein
MKHLNASSYIVLATTGILLSHANAAQAATLWDTLQPNSAIAFSSQLDTPTETADDFTVTGKGFKVTDVSFLGLFSDPNAQIEDVDLAFYQVFPGSSDLTRTPVTVRENGPEDEEFAAFGLADNKISIKTTDLGSFTVNKTILPGSGPNAPGLGSGVVGGPLTGNLRQIDVKLKTPLNLPPQAVFLVAAVDPSVGDFFQVAGTRPPNFPNPLPPGVVDRQAWFRTNEPFPNALEPDWIRISDVINQENGTADPALNSAFRVNGQPIPEPSSILGSLAFGLLGAGYILKRQQQRRNKTEF